MPRTHHVTTVDGVRIGGTVHGQGPSLVFLHGIIGDGDTDWRPLVGHLGGRFTCHLPSERGRGLSDDHPDLSLGRRVADALAYVGSIGEPTGVVGWSAGGAMALAVAAQSGAVRALAVHEPVMDSLMVEQERTALGDAVARMGQLAAAGDLAAAVRAFAGFVCQDAELAVLEDAGYFEATGRHAPNVLRSFQQAAGAAGPAGTRPSVSPADPAVLGAIQAPVLVLHGAASKPFWTRFAHHVADHVPDARMRALAGAGHGAPLTHPEAMAEALTEFFPTAEQPS